MDFFKLIKSLDDLVFEVLGWLYFYPRTLFRVIFKPFGLMSDTEKQMDEDDEPAWGDRIGPPLFLALTLVIVHLIELAIGIDSTAEYENAAIRELMEDDTNLLALRIVLFGALPLLAASRELRARGLHLTKSSMKAPFYAQCYAAAGYAVLVNAAYFAGHLWLGPKPELGAFGLLGGLLVAILWIGFVESRWFHRTLEISRGRAFLHTVQLLLQWLLLAAAMTLIFT